MQRLNAASYLLFALLATLAHPLRAEHLRPEPPRSLIAWPEGSAGPAATNLAIQAQSPPPAGHETTPPTAAIQPGPKDGSIIDPQIIVDARAGDPVAQYKLGYDYYLGHGISQDYAQAAIWWRKAAEQGYADAQNNLGVLYNSGKGVPQSYAEAYFWQNLAAARSNGDRQAQFAKNRDDSAAKLSFFERLRVQKRASRWSSEHPAPKPKPGDTPPAKIEPSKPDQPNPAQPASPNPQAPPQ